MQPLPALPKSLLCFVLNLLLSHLHIDESAPKIIGYVSAGKTLLGLDKTPQIVLTF